MKRTGNKIVVNLCVDGEFQDVPVMRKGKPTKRTKRQWVPIYEDRELTGIEVQGHEIFIDEKKLDNEKYANCWMGNNTVAYKADGSILKCNCKFGCYGKADHKEVVYYNKKRNCFTVSTNGYSGPCGVGAGAYIKNIIW